MKELSTDDINKVLDKLQEGEGNPFDALFDDMAMEQPKLMDYLHEVEGEEFNDDERDLLINSAIMGWFIVKEVLDVKKVVSDEHIDAMLEKNVELFEKNEKEEEESDEEFIEFISTFNKQPILMEFLMGLFMAFPDDYTGIIREDSVPYLMLHVKNVVDCLLVTDIS